MSNKIVQLKDLDGNNIYPKIPVTNVMGLTPTLDNRHIYFGSGEPSSVKSNFEDIQENDLYIDTSNSRVGIFYRVITFFSADVTRIRWDIHSDYFIKSGTPPTTPGSWSGIAPTFRVGLLWCDINTGHIYELINYDGSILTWRCLTDTYSKSELDAMIATFQPDEKADRIEDSRQGSAITLEDSADIEIPEITLFGKSVQNGTPSIDNPLPIVDITSEEVQVKKRNLLTIADVNKQNLFKIRSTYIYNTTTNEYEITCTENGDIQLGDYRQQGQTSTEYSFNNMVIKTRIEEGKTYKISSKNGVFTRFLIFIYDDNRKVLLSPASASTVTITITAPSGSKWLGVRADISNGTSGTVYKDMIMVSANGDSTYEDPITPQTANLSKTLRGIPVTSGGNYTDNNGQQWICDTIEKYKDGSGKYIQRVGSITYNGSEENWVQQTNNRLGISLQTKESNTTTPCSMSTHFQLINNAGGVGYYDNSYVLTGTGFYCSPTINGTRLSVEEWKTFLQTNNTTVKYVLIEPIERSLTAEELAQLDLSTYYPITNITSTPDIKITYVADTKNYFDKKIEQVQNAIISNGGNV